jgi:integrase
MWKGWKLATVDNHRRDLRRLILPTLGNIAVDKLGKADVTIWLDQLDISGRTKDRATSVLSSMMRHAETLGLRPAGSNPCAGRRRHRSTFSARYLAVRDLRRLVVALDQAAQTDPVQVACIRFLRLTGVRRGEALALEWPMIEGDRAILPDSKTGPKCLWLATPVRRLLAELIRIEGSPLVFTRPCGGGLGSSLERVWHGVREGAGLDGLRLHDLRHNYASVAVNIGEELRTVAGLLGHSQMTTTRGYAHLADRPVMAAARRVDEHLAASLEPLETVEPIRLKSWGPKKKKKAPEPPALMPVYLPDLPKPVTPKIELSEGEQRWTPHLRAWRKTKLGLPEFCSQEGLDPAAMRKALARHFKRARQQVEEQRP